METRDTILLPRLVLKRAEAAGLDPRALAEEAGIPAWALADNDTQIAGSAFLRLFELAEHYLADPNFGVHAADEYIMGEFGIWDYLFATAPTLGAAITDSAPYLGSVTTNYHYSASAATESLTDVAVQVVQGQGRGAEAAALFALGRTLARARHVTGAPINPTRVTTRRRAPRDTSTFVEFFGTTAIEFDAPTDTMTLRTVDLELPLVTADPRLAALLRRHAASMPQPAPQPTRWAEQVATVLTSALDSGSVSLASVAHSLATSPRTLQRRLTESGTTWRRELERARQTRLEQATTHGALTRSMQAELLGYADAGAMRRAAGRWAKRTPN